MALDPQIPLSVRPFQGVNLLAIQENQRRQEQERRLAEQDKFEQEKYAAARQELVQQQAEKKALGEAYQSAGGDRQELLNQMVRRGLAHKVPDAIKQFNELDKASLEMDEIQARTDELKSRRNNAQKQGVERIGALIEALGNDQHAWEIGRKVAIDGKWGSEEDLTPYDTAVASDPSKIAAITAVMQKKAGSKAPDQMKASDLVQVIGPDGKPTWIEASQAVGKPAYEKPTTTSDRLVEVAGPGGSPVFMKQSEAAGQTPYVKPDKGPAPEKKRGMTAGAAERMAQIGSSQDQLAALERTLTPGDDVAKRGAASALPNWFTAMTGVGTEAKKRQATIMLVKQIIGKGLEGGVLRKEDESKYEQILPTMWDNDEIVAGKLAGLKTTLQSKKDNELSAQEDAGYDVSRFRARETKAPETPTPKLTGRSVRSGVVTPKVIRFR